MTKVWHNEKHDIRKKQRIIQCKQKYGTMKFMKASKFFLKRATQLFIWEYSDNLHNNNNSMERYPLYIKNHHFTVTWRAKTNFSNTEISTVLNNNNLPNKNGKNCQRLQKIRSLPNQLNYAPVKLYNLNDHVTEKKKKGYCALQR